MRTFARLLAVLVVATAAVLSGCVSYRPVQPLDHDELAEMSALMPRIREEHIRIVQAEEWAEEDAASLASTLRFAGATVTDTADDAAPTLTLTLEALQTWRTLDEPMLLVLSLGIIPHFSSGWRRYRWRLVAADGRRADEESELTSPAWIGWLVPPIALLPGWRLTTTWSHDSWEEQWTGDATRARLALALARSIVRLRDPESVTR